MPSFNFAAWLAEPTRKVAIVGATGWVGRAFLHAALEAGELSSDRLRLFSGRGGTTTAQGRTFVTETLDEMTTLGSGEWIVVHAGVIGGDTRQRNDDLLRQVLLTCEGAQVRRLVLTSSGAAGFSDAPTAKAAYARMKREHEEEAARWSRDAGIPLLVPRIFNLGGPYMTCAANYALGDFILRLRADGRLAIGAADPVVRSYVHVLDMARAVLDMAVDEAEDEAPFDIARNEVVELGDLARLVADGLGLPDAVIERPAPTGGPADHYVGDGGRYLKALNKGGRTPTPLPAIVADTIDWLATRRR